MHNLAAVQGGAVDEANAVDDQRAGLAQAAHEVGRALAALFEPVVDHIGKDARPGLFDRPVGHGVGEEGIAGVDLDSTHGFGKDWMAGTKSKGPVGEGHDIILPPERKVIRPARAQVSLGLPVGEAVEIVAVDPDHGLVFGGDPIGERLAADRVGIGIKPAMMQHDKIAPEVRLFHGV